MMFLVLLILKAHCLLRVCEHKKGLGMNIFKWVSNIKNAFKFWAGEDLITYFEFLDIIDPNREEKKHKPWIDFSQPWEAKPMRSRYNNHSQNSQLPDTSISSHSHNTINPASGASMIGSVDIHGNPFGTVNPHNHSSHYNPSDPFRHH